LNESTNLQSKVEETKDVEEEGDMPTEPSSLFDLSFQSEPKFKERNPTKLPIPPAATTLRQPPFFSKNAAAHCGEADGSVQYVSPDDDENEEPCNSWRHSCKSMGAKISNSSTRVLTISGPLDSVHSKTGKPSVAETRRDEKPFDERREFGILSRFHEEKK
jgi:hypothetical protein